ncbi:FAD-binding oxidoreductase [Sphingomonas sp. 28-63-12]|uniref:NAD(P)/FAD-dependent oxidoreductase n=1 Tax=Sphingomonas sp. 28-63-12 TaxID=1970434 RepID=UPI000BCE0AE0|nr:MAG: FAD-dependent oxidoreductase [Sphingomonas sp. 28-63-12]
MSTSHQRVDIAIIGAGIAGASLAAALAPHARVLLIEAEDMPGYHSTGRSAAFWHETLGGPLIQPLTRASYGALDAGGFLTPRASLEVAEADGLPLLDKMARDFAGTGVGLTQLDHDGIRGWVPRARPILVGGLLESTGADIDVAGLHASVLAAFRRAGGELVTARRVDRIERRGSDWMLQAADWDVTAGIIVNAAGAWADGVAGMAGARPLDIQPKRRTIVQVRVATDDVPDTLPLVIDIAGSYYFRPEGPNRLWLCPHDETPVEPGDVAPEEIDVAIAIDRFETVTDWQVVAVERKWAGLRSFTPDRLPVFGFDIRLPGFFWFAAQGGVGIQTAPAAALLGAALVLNGAVPAGIDADRYAPGRFG